MVPGPCTRWRRWELPRPIIALVVPPIYVHPAEAQPDCGVECCIAEVHSNRLLPTSWTSPSPVKMLPPPGQKEASIHRWDLYIYSSCSWHNHWRFERGCVIEVGLLSITQICGPCIYLVGWMLNSPAPPKKKSPAAPSCEKVNSLIWCWAVSPEHWKKSSQ